jgi:hypothetical protein
MVDDWKTEWLKDGVSMTDLKSYVDELVNDRHYRIKVIAEDYDFTQGIL